MDDVRSKQRHLLVMWCALGFSAFKAAQSVLYSTAVLTSDTTTVLIAGFDFSVASALFVLLADTLIVIAALRGRLPAMSVPIVVPSAILAAAACFSFAGGFSTMDPAVSLLVLALAQGISTAMLTLAWVELFTTMKPADSMKALAFAMLLASLVSYALRHAPSPVILIAVLVLLLANVALCRKAKCEANAVPQNEPSRGSASQLGTNATRSYLKGFLSIGEGLLSLLVLGCTVGIINGFMVVQHYNFEGSSLASSLGVIAASVAFFVMAYGFPKTFSASRAYRALFPLLTGVLIVWPFANFQYGYFVSAAFVAGHSLISTSVMFLIVRESHESRLNPYVFMGTSVVLIRLASMLGIVGGSAIAGLDINPPFKTMLVFCIAVYLLSLALLFMLRIRKRSATTTSGNDAEGSAPSSTENGSFCATGQEISVRCKLTDRESEILLLLARGRSSTYIGEALYLSPNTVRGHIKNIYAKLEVHSKQEIIDLFTDQAE